MAISSLYVICFIIHVEYLVTANISIIKGHGYEHVGVGKEFIELIILSKFAVSAAVAAIKWLLPIAST